MFKRLKISTRIALVVAVMFALFILSVSLTVSVDRTMSVIMEGFYKEQFQIVVQARTTNGGVEGTSRSLLYAILSEDKQTAQIYIEEADEKAQTVRRAVAALEYLYSPNPQVVSEIKGYHTQLGPAREEIVAALQAEDYEGAKNLYTTRYSPPAAELRALVLALCSQAEQDAQLYIRQSDQNSANLRTGVIAISILMGAVAVVMSMWIVRSITRPVHELKRASLDIAQGRLNATIEYTSSDELGQLAESMRSSVHSLSGYIGEIRRSLTALGKGDLDYEAKDIFAGDFESIKTSIDTIAELLKAQKIQDEKSHKQLEAAYNDAKNANNSKSEFLSRMSHDIRTPMNAIIGMTAIATANVHDTEKVLDALRKISLSSKHLLGLINDVLDMSKIESGRMSLNNDNILLPEVMENIVNIVQPQIGARRQNFNIRLHNVQHEKLYADSLRLNQVFINILSNAVKFTPVGGSINLDVEEIASQKPGFAHFRFCFEDTGVGMSQDFIDHIFDAFVREEKSGGAKTEGSGLGMAISKRIVDMMEGDIQVYSKQGVGSRFVVGLHLQTERAENTELKLPALHVLVVDDDKVACETVVQALREIGMRADWENSGEAALRRVKKAQAGPNAYMAIILDYQMPGMNGIETARAIRAEVGKSVPILIISAYDWADFEEEAKDAGIDGFMPKPLFKSTIYNTLRRHVLREDDKNNRGANEDERYDFTGKNILLVEDNELNREIALELLRPTGATLQTAADGAEAVALFTQAPAGTYDLILMDIQMPTMNGYEATREIRALPREDALSVPIIAMTADAFSEDIAAAKTAGMNYHLAKPLDIAPMLRKLKELLFPRGKNNA